MFFTVLVIVNERVGRAIINLFAVVSKSVILICIYTELIDVYGIDLTVPCAVFPLLAAIYAAAVQVTREMCKNADYDPSTYLELYNVMAIRVDEDETVLLRPLRTLKEGVKGDSKIADMHVDMM